MGEMIEAIVRSRDWSWSLIGLFDIVGGLMVRSFLLRDILRGMKIRNRSWYERTQDHYQRRAVLGWIFFLFFALGTMLFWRFELFFLRFLNLFQWVLVLTGLLVLSLFSHLRAYARAIVEAVEESVGTDKDL